MGDPTTPPPPMPQNTVVFNGAAVNLMTALVEGVRTDMRAMRNEMSEQIEKKFEDHEKTHAETREKMTGVQDKILDRIDGLETADRDAAIAVKVARAKREGQLAIFKFLANFWDRYDKWILATLGIIFGFAASVLTNVKITIGS